MAPQARATWLARLPAFLTLAILGMIGNACSDSKPSSFPAENIEIIIPYSPGGGFDIYVRALIPYIEKHLPNDARVLPVNAAGAGGQRGANLVYRAEPDGYTIGVFNLPGVLIPQLQANEAGYDLFKITWLATLSKDPYAIVVKKESTIASIEALKQRESPVRYGATGPSSTSYIATTLVSNALGIPYKVVTGYKGSTGYLVGVMRGEIDAAFANYSTAEPYVESGDVDVLALIGAESSMPDVPDAAALGIPEFDNVGVVRMLGAPPGLPPDVAATLERAVLDALADEGFQSWLAQTGNDAFPAGGAATTAAVARMKDFYEPYKDDL